MHAPLIGVPYDLFQKYFSNVPDSLFFILCKMYVIKDVKVNQIYQQCTQCNIRQKINNNELTGSSGGDFDSFVPISFSAPFSVYVCSCVGTQYV